MNRAHSTFYSDGSKIKMYPAKPLSTKVVMSVLIAILTSSAVLGNGFVLAVIARFKSLRTIPNILVANLALVDLLNAVLNMPFRMISAVLEASWFTGKTLAIMTSVLDRLFRILNLVSMLAMMVDVYLAISYEFGYHIRKTKEKALACVFSIWFISIVAVMFSTIPLLDIDLGDAHVKDYRAAAFKQAKYFVASFFALFIFCGIVVYFLTTRAIRIKKEERVKLNLPRIQAEARLESDIKAINTITITMVAYFLCYVPSIVYALAGLQKETLADSWFGFIAFFSLGMQSVVNPIIYYLRKSRCRSAFKQFLKDPCGSSDFKEKPNGPGIGKKRPGEVTARRRNSEKGERGEKCDIGRDGHATERKYSGKRRDASAISSIKGLDAESYRCHNEDERYGREAKNVGGACASHYQLQNSHAGEEPANDEENDELSKKFALNLEQQQSFSTRIKVSPLKCIEMGKTHQIADQIQESSGRIEDSKTTTKRFRKVLKTAWIVEEEHCQEQKQKQKAELEQEQNQNQKQEQELEMEEAVSESEPEAKGRISSSRSAIVIRDGGTTRSSNKRQKQRKESELEQEQNQNQKEGKELEMEEAVIESEPGETEKGRSRSGSGSRDRSKSGSSKREEQEQEPELEKEQNQKQKLGREVETGSRVRAETEAEPEAKERRRRRSGSNSRDTTRARFRNKVEEQEKETELEQELNQNQKQEHEGEPGPRKGAVTDVNPEAKERGGSSCKLWQGQEGKKQEQGAWEGTGRQSKAGAQLNEQQQSQCYQLFS